MCLQTFSNFPSSLLHPSFQVSVIATSDDEYAKNLADSFETAARLQGIRIHASSRFSSTASSDVLDNKLQLVRVDTMEPRCSEILYNEVLGKTKNILCINNSKVYQEEPRYDETSL